MLLRCCKTFINDACCVLVGAPQGAIAQYEDTAKAQQQALLRAAERNALENQRQQLDARKSGQLS